MDKFGGLTKTSSRIAIAAALGMTLGGFVMSSHPAKAADLGGDCCADLEERVAELEATTVRKGNKKVSVTISGWVVKLGTWWNDGHTGGLYWGDKDTTLSSHIQISGSATIAPGWSAGYTLWLETPGNSASAGFVENQFDDNNQLVGPGGINTLDSFMWIKSDTWGTTNWGRLVQATNNLALLPDLSGTIIESNGVLFDGAGFFIRPNHVKNSNDLATDFNWLSVVSCLSGGGGVGADCPTGLDGNGVRYDSPTWYGFSVSGGYYENYEWDVAAKWAGDWDNLKWSLAYGFTENTDEGCNAAGIATNSAEAGGGGCPFQGFRKDVESNQFGASVLHVPTGLWAYGMFQNEHNDGTPFLTLNENLDIVKSAANDTDVWFAKAGIKRTWVPLGATVIWGEGGQYFDEFGNGQCFGNQHVLGVPGNQGFCGNLLIPSGQLTTGPFDGQNILNQVAVNGSTVNRWGAGIVQEIDSAAMHVFFRWQHLELQDFRMVCTDEVDGCISAHGQTVDAGDRVKESFKPLDLFQVGGVIFF
jgi:hypothetical protein